LIRVIALNELRRRLRDRSVLIGCLAAPLLMAAVLGLSFAGSGATVAVRVGVSGASPQLMAAAEHASQLPPGVTVVPSSGQLVLPAESPSGLFPQVSTTVGLTASAAGTRNVTFAFSVPGQSVHLPSVTVAVHAEG